MRVFTASAIMLSIIVMVTGDGLKLIGPGGSTTASREELLKDESFIDGLKEVDEELRAENGGKCMLDRHTIRRATKQIVQGMMYSFIANFVDRFSGEPCLRKPCKVTIWSRPWLKEDEKFVINICGNALS